MKKQTARRMLALTMAGAMALSMTACGGGDKGSGEKADIDLTIDQIKLGEDYTDISADLKFLTHKTDVIDTRFRGYIEEIGRAHV